MHTQKEDDCMSSQEWDKFGDKGIRLKLNGTWMQDSSNHSNLVLFCQFSF